MILFNYAVFFVFIATCFGCTRFPIVVQVDFCKSDFVFEANITSSKISADIMNYEYEFDVKTVFKGTAKNIPSTLIGDGYFMNCGPEKVRLNTAYVIFAKRGDDGALRFLFYINMRYVKSTDFERMTTKYDCDCKINIVDYSDVSVQSVTTSKPSTSACVTPQGFCSRSGFCQKNSEGVCTWGNHGECY
ncbi:uncharacterized protein LOC128164333 [Crassostrea angulata]|uniref:uncharacterized protein LOC128164333 n=1 Tax=Magallana angulata TaxID=2784310 RepID=UPI0022B0DA7D|nr:uncharacterized protein LOC128164333 [Crassostrea angulata]